MDNIIHPLDYCISTALLGDLLGAIDHLATNNVVHTRLAPEHIYLCARGPVNWLKIGHFESAVALINGLDVPGKCQQEFGVFDDLDEKMSLCLAKYFAPEVVRNIGYNTDADMYSVGAIAEYMFGLNITETARSRITFTDHSIPRKYCRKLYDIVEKMSDKDRSLRPTARRVLDTQSEYVVYDYLDVNSAPIKSIVMRNPDFFDNPFVQKYLAHKLALNMVAEVVVA
ncbi:unnamed protein product [Medioppia subpectinata]|uniref:Protein kinase domain-containing protein n=1 Tax=Medioppia subpectinata TaxID=1979941 RepID=A0A7R9LJT2_9ACAR|nr:unnamed protein product [Medioppia subpectinata]CAG2119111.1 unnamed protein product [Medioppia subpectinata]